MGVYKIFPSQDTTIYTDYTKLNAGLDEILDLSKNAPLLSPSSSTSRILIKFDNTDIADAISKSGANFTASLKLYNANVDGIPTWECGSLGIGSGPLRVIIEDLVELVE